LIQRKEPLLAFLASQADYWIAEDILGELQQLLKPAWWLLKAKGLIPQDITGNEPIIAACFRRGGRTLGLRLARRGKVVGELQSTTMEIVIDVQQWKVCRIGFEDYRRVNPERPKPTPKRLPPEPMLATKGLFEKSASMTPTAKPARQPKQDGRQKLTSEQVSEIKRLVAKGTTGHELARRFGVSNAAISNIVTGRTWAEVE